MRWCCGGETQARGASRGVKIVLALKRKFPTYDTAFQIVSWAAEKDLLFLDLLLRGHFLPSSAGKGSERNKGVRGGVL